MNIKEAKQEIQNTVQAYLQKDENGNYKIPLEKQRPVLLMGPPGIGKTAIMEQIAQELHVNLVAYTITHHTRQSAIGLPFISKKNYEGQEYSVTEYTMSEIIAAIYDQIERSGIHEGILFLDEINCVSETLVPTMLQFLQYKTFGTHKVPDGFIIVTAGNPPQYNQSVRDFDIVTLDRVRCIDIEADFAAWKEYAGKSMVHGAIMAYLEIRKENFYKVLSGVDGKKFVTARGWEDLSKLLTVYEELGLPVDSSLTGQFLQDKETAEDFATYYELYHKYKDVYQIAEILKGRIPEAARGLNKAPFDEKLSILGLMNDALSQEFRERNRAFRIQKELLAVLKNVSVTKASVSSETGCGSDANSGKAALSLTERIGQQKELLLGRLNRDKAAGLLEPEEENVQRAVLRKLEELNKRLTLSGIRENELGTELKRWFADEEAQRKKEAAQTGEHLSNCFAFLKEIFGEGQEMVMFLAELDAGYQSLAFIRREGNDVYYQYNELLLLKDRRSELKDEILKLQMEE